MRNIQKQILADYRRDFSKHVPADMLPKVNMVWDAIPAQLARENKKFMYSAIKKGGRAREFENAIQWLIDAGLVYKVLRVAKAEKPLKFYEDPEAFKLFLLDLGLLGALSDADAGDALVNNKAFTEYKGAFTEQYSCRNWQLWIKGFITIPGNPRNLKMILLCKSSIFIPLR
ncbi:DUF4143 domain-containing protein [Succinimonas sp.]|uniref:DUF4143 domain-containing protein n=2 Tax=Succinimonas sp. TaxID=1936151 RepID=UPI00386BBADE